MDKTGIENCKHIKFITFINNYPLTILYVIILFGALLVICFDYHDKNELFNEATCSNCRITTVKNIEKANEIQTFLAKQNCFTEHKAEFDKDGKIVGYKITLKNAISKKDYYNAISELLDSSIVDSSVESPISSTFYRIKLDKQDNNKNQIRIKFKAYSPK